MKRSQVNEIIRNGDAFFRSLKFALPPFAYWSPGRLRAADGDHIRQHAMGWDITDFGLDAFDETGLLLFTTRNGDLTSLGAPTGMMYAEKIMILRSGQRCPRHKHVVKTEDIINRGGGDLVLELFGSRPDGTPDEETPIDVTVDGSQRRVAAGGHVRLTSGESVTLIPGVWHAFWAEDGDALIGEVSTVNDDASDNLFDPPLPRFSQIIEDEAPLHLLVSDY